MYLQQQNCYTSLVAGSFVLSLLTCCQPLIPAHWSSLIQNGVSSPYNSSDPSKFGICGSSPRYPGTLCTFPSFPMPLKPGVESENIQFTRFINGSCAVLEKLDDDGTSCTNSCSEWLPRALPVSRLEDKAWREWNTVWLPLPGDNRLYWNRDKVLVPNWLSVIVDCWFVSDGVGSTLWLSALFLGVFPDVCLERFLFSINFNRKPRMAAPQVLGHMLPRTVKCFRISRARSASL